MGITVIVDTHTHVVSSDEARYPLQCIATRADDPSSWPLHARVTAEELATEMLASGVERACLVQGWAAYQFDNRYTLAAAEADAAHFVSVCALDTQDPQAPSQLEAMTARPRLRGIRLVSGFMQTGDSLDSAGAQAVWDAADRLGLVVVAFTFADQLEPFVSAARIHGQHPVVLDHCAFVDVVKDFERLAPIARLENVYLKVSTRILSQGEPARIVRQLVNRFGAERLMWGSDYPASHERSYREWVELARAATEGLSEGEAERFLSGTALELWPELH
jgi:predicted TIM-barrel fold metal-dependent hydrolase